MPSLKNKFILFDFDGVLVQTLALTLEIIQRKNPGHTLEMIRKNMEGSIYDSPAVDQKHFEEFFSQYAQEIMKLPVMLGIQPALKKLAQEHTLIIVSSTITAPISAYADFHNLSRYFAEILGGDHEKSKTKKFQIIFKKYGVRAQDCVFIPGEYPAVSPRVWAN